MTWRRTVAILPGIGVSLMPKLICPLCWPAYAGLLSAVGLGFLSAPATCSSLRNCS
jgi:mercuric ion transport protein